MTLLDWSAPDLNPKYSLTQYSGEFSDPLITDSIVAEYNWVCDRTNYRNLFFAANGIGMAIGCLISGPLTENYGFGLSMPDFLSMLDFLSILDLSSQLWLWSTNQKTQILDDIAIVCFRGRADPIMGFRKLIHYHTCSYCDNGCLRNQIFSLFNICYRSCWSRLESTYWEQVASRQLKFEPGMHAMHGLPVLIRWYLGLNSKPIHHSCSIQQWIELWLLKLWKDFNSFILCIWVCFIFRKSLKYINFWARASKIGL